MTVTTCDLCGERILNEVIRIEVGDGRHPHKGEQLTRVIDCCARCAAAVPGLSVKMDLAELKRDADAGGRS